MRMLIAPVQVGSISDKISLGLLGQQEPKAAVVVGAAGLSGGLRAYAGIDINMPRAFNGTANILGDEKAVIIADDALRFLIKPREGGKQATAQGDIAAVNSNRILAGKRHAARTFGLRAPVGEKGIGRIVEEYRIQQRWMLFEIAPDAADGEVLQGDILSAHDEFFNTAVRMAVGAVVGEKLTGAIGEFYKTRALHLHVINIDFIRSIG